MTSCQLTSHAGFNGEPEYLPDGAKIAFESDRGAGFAGTEMSS